MRLIVFFDLPTTTKPQVRVYNKFRKALIENGYIMIQLSIYVKSFANRDSCVKHIQVLKRLVPEQGHVRIMMITEKQYAAIEILVGGVSKQEELSDPEKMVIL